MKEITAYDIGDTLVQISKNLDNELLELDGQLKLLMSDAVYKKAIGKFNKDKFISQSELIKMEYTKVRENYIKVQALLADMPGRENVAQLFNKHFSWHKQ